MQKRRLLDDHVLAGGKGAERPFEVCRRRERHEDHRDVAALHGRRVVGEVTGAGVPSRRRRAAAVVAARIEPPDVGRNGAQRLGVEIGRHAGSEERDPLVHSVAAMCVPVRSALAAIVSDGFTPPERGRALPSVT